MTIKVISSMATKAVLGDLVLAYRRVAGVEVAVETAGGMDVLKRVRAAEPFDAVILAANMIDDLISEGRIVAGSRVDLVKSGIAAAVRAGAAHPDISSEAAIKRAVAAARVIGISTGPSGVYLAKMLEGWRKHDGVDAQIVTAPPGVPVGTLLAKGEVALGFQQLSELLGLPGIDIIGPLPVGVQLITTFSGGIAATSKQPDAARGFFAYFNTSESTATKQKHGMEPA